MAWVWLTLTRHGHLSVSAERALALHERPLLLIQDQQQAGERVTFVLRYDMTQDIRGEAAGGRRRDVTETAGGERGSVFLLNLALRLAGGPGS